MYLSVLGLGTFDWTMVLVNVVSDFVSCGMGFSRLGIS